MAKTRSDTSKPPSVEATENERLQEGVTRGSENSAPDLSTPQSPRSSPDDRVAQRAYEIYCERGCEHGHDIEDWLQAKRELRQRTDGDPGPE